MFQREDVVLSQESVAPITWDRRSLTPSETPTPGVALGIFGLVMLLIFYAGTALQSWRLHAGLALTQYGVILLPVLAALWYGKVDFRSALNLRRPTWAALGGTALLALGWTVISIEIGLFLGRLMPPPEELQDLSKQLFDVSALPGGIVTLVAIVALSPAICEEALFRGVLTSGLRTRLPGWGTVLAIGLLFGAFHLSFHRFIPTALSGIVFTYLVIRTGSIFCSALAHFTLNGLAILVETGTLPDPIVEPLAAIEAESGHVPVAWLLGAGIAFAVGIAIVEYSARGGQASSRSTMDSSA
jgi:membrane protease YdiL (CAAX protease family)